MRQMQFKVEQEDVIHEGEVVKVIESKLPSSYYYTIEHALGMSGNYKTLERLKTFEGKVVKVERTPQGQYATLEFAE